MGTIIAILSLSKAIEKDPDNKEAYFERAVAYFEHGEFDLALQDYLSSGMKPTFGAADYYEYGKGFISGIKKGIQEELQDNLPLTAPLLNIGLWALTNAPTPYTRVITASMACIAAAGLYLTADQMISELRELVSNWNQLSPEQQGELCGYLIGKHGIDIFAVAGSAKMMEAYRTLKRANNMLSFELILTQETERAAVKDFYNKKLGSTSSLADMQASLVKKEIDINVFLKAGQAADRAGFTKTGRGLMKHGNRAGSVFPRPAGNIEQVNRQGQKVLEEILNDVDKKIVTIQVSKRLSPSAQG